MILYDMIFWIFQFLSYVVFEPYFFSFFMYRKIHIKSWFLTSIIYIFQVYRSSILRGRGWSNLPPSLKNVNLLFDKYILLKERENSYFSPFQELIYSRLSCGYWRETILINELWEKDVFRSRAPLWITLSVCL